MHETMSLCVSQLLSWQASTRSRDTKEEKDETEEATRERRKKMEHRSLGFGRVKEMSQLAPHSKRDSY